MISEISCSLLAIVAESPAPLWPTLELGENRSSKDKVENSCVFRFCTQPGNLQNCLKYCYQSPKLVSSDCSFLSSVRVQTAISNNCSVLQAQQEGCAPVNIKKGVLPPIPLQVCVLDTLTGFRHVCEMFHQWHRNHHLNYYNWYTMKDSFLKIF